MSKANILEQAKELEVLAKQYSTAKRKLLAETRKFITDEVREKIHKSNQEEAKLLMNKLAHGYGSDYVATRLREAIEIITKL